MTKHSFKILIAAFSLTLFSCSNQYYSCKPPQQSLQDFLTYKKGNKNNFIIMAHRNAPPATGYAENSIAALQHTYNNFPCAIQEVDFRMSKDSMLLLLHDATLDRTTTGKGPVNQLTWKELQTLELKDESNNLLKGQRIPTAEEILTTAHGKIMLALDVKPGTDLTRTMALIEKTNTLNDVFIICYTIADAQKLNKLYPTLKLALGFNDPKSIATIQQAGIPYKNLLALTPQKLQEKSFYKKIHEMGILTSVGTYGNVDTLPNKKALKEYKRILKYGGDIITADSASKVTMMFNKRK